MRSNATWELPPRARRIPEDPTKHQVKDGTTSVHAENTLCNVFQLLSIRNYLRARGEYLNELGLL